MFGFAPILKETAIGAIKFYWSPNFLTAQRSLCFRDPKNCTHTKGVNNNFKIYEDIKASGL